MPLTIPLALLVSIGAYTRWKRDSLERIGKKLLVPLALSIIIGTLAPLFQSHYSINAALGCILGSWTILSSFSLIYDRLRIPSGGFRAMQSAPKGFYGMVAGHVGLGVFVIGVTMTSAYSIEKDLRVTPEEQITVSGYTFTFEGVDNVEGPNFSAFEGQVKVTEAGATVALLTPQKRAYNSGSPMTEASIDAGLFRDLYVALGEPIGKQGAWALRIYHKPLIRWIWLGALIMAFGGLLAAADPRYRKLAAKEAERAKDKATAAI